MVSIILIVYDPNYAPHDSEDEYDSYDDDQYYYEYEAVYSLYDKDADYVKFYSEDGLDNSVYNMNQIIYVTNNEYDKEWYDDFDCYDETFDLDDMYEDIYHGDDEETHTTKT